MTDGYDHVAIFGYLFHGSTNSLSFGRAFTGVRVDLIISGECCCYVSGYILGIHRQRVLWEPSWYELGCASLLLLRGNETSVGI